jgi:hypothetical protein
MPARSLRHLVPPMLILVRISFPFPSPFPLLLSNHAKLHLPACISPCNHQLVHQHSLLRLNFSLLHIALHGHFPIIFAAGSSAPSLNIENFTTRSISYPPHSWLLSFPSQHTFISDASKFPTSSLIAGSSAHPYFTHVLNGMFSSSYHSKLLASSRSITTQFP